MITIGLFSEFYSGGYPSIIEMTADKAMDKKAIIMKYLKDGHSYAASPSILRDVFNGELIGEELNMLTDGTYEWRSDLAYYFGKYNVKLPDEFVKYVLSKQV